MARTILRIALFGAFGALYLWMAHQAATSNSPSSLVVLVGFVPFAAMLSTWCWATRARLPVLAAVAGAFALAHLYTPQLIGHIVWIYFLQDLSCNLFAASVFAVSLRPSSEALCTRLARLAHPQMPPNIARYTRQITYAWAIFFGACVLLSAVLFLSGHVAAWSWFANVLTLPLVGVMFAVEYLVRICVIPKTDRAGIMENIRSVAAYGQPGMKTKVQSMKPELSGKKS